MPSFQKHFLALMRNFSYIFTCTAWGTDLGRSKFSELHHGTLSGFGQQEEIAGKVIQVAFIM